MHVFCLANNKGGVTKTTTTVNLAYGLARAGKRVLVIDSDAQSNSTYSLMGRLDMEHSLDDVLYNNTRIADIIVHTQHKNLYLAPASIDMSNADLALANAAGRELRLKRSLRSVSNQFDYVLIDTPPNLGVLTVNAFLACTAVIIPVALTTYALIGIGILERTIQELRENMEIPLPIFGVVANLNDNTRISNAVLNEVRSHFGELVFQTVIPRNIRVEEAHNQTTSIFNYAPLSKGAVAYEQLTQEVIQRAES